MKRKPSIRLKYQPIKIDHYKDWTLEYRPTLGWLYYHKGDKMVNVLYVESKKDLIRYIDKNEQ